MGGRAVHCAVSQTQGTDAAARLGLNFEFLYALVAHRPPLQGEHGGMRGPPTDEPYLMSAVRGQKKFGWNLSGVSSPPFATSLLYRYSAKGVLLVLLGNLLSCLNFGLLHSPWPSKNCANFRLLSFDELPLFAALICCLSVCDHTNFPQNPNGHTLYARWRGSSFSKSKCSMS